MHCPFCNHTDTQVMETRVLDGGDRIRRRAIPPLHGLRPALHDL